MPVSKDEEDQLGGSWVARDSTPFSAEDRPSSSCEFKNGSWVCRPYKKEFLCHAIQDNPSGKGRRNAIIQSLRDMGIKVYVIDGGSFDSSAEVLSHVRRVVGVVARENRRNAVTTQTKQSAATNQQPYQRCLLYQDKRGRLFNLVLPQEAAGHAGAWQQYLYTFAAWQAMVALTVLCRSLPCARADKIDTLRPAYLSLILGLVLSEEIGYSWLNACMLVQAAPSVSAYTLTSLIPADLLRQALLACLALASAATGLTQKIMTLTGISAACMVLLVNLGSRSWHYLNWKPLWHQGIGASFLAYAAAFGTGIAAPYAADRTVTAGGKAAVENVLLTALIVAVVFVLSDLDEVQKFLVVGSETCNQDYVNIVVGGWWACSLLVSLILVAGIPRQQKLPEHPDLEDEGEHFLIPDQTSPVGYKVPKIPNFEIDPTVAKSGWFPCFPVWCEIATGVLLALAIGAGIVYLGFTDFDEKLMNGLR